MPESQQTSGTPGFTAGEWRMPAANLFRVVAPDAPHRNEASGMAPPYPWAIVCDTDPSSVGGQQAAANARLIASSPDLYAVAQEMAGQVGHARSCKGWIYSPTGAAAFGDALDCDCYLSRLRAALARVEGRENG